ncbi:hypothetical protein [Miltoncostaea oceani]|jgi:hypothetical protein|uniref:hypothetical protein n=1 Tax=Miltoncostaea oceani TaxID=2843216 RepID=UPI001C3CD9A6|nr:hypothetical protein [Miltoncostaea oceani]
MFALAVPPAPVATPPPARVLTFADEFRFTGTRRSVPAGPVLLQVKNIGEDDHDLRIVGPRGTARGETGVVGPGDLGRLKVRLTRGRYTFYCTVSDHRERGMGGTLLVTKRRTAAR